MSGEEQPPPTAGASEEQEVHDNLSGGRRGERCNDVNDDERRGMTVRRKVSGAGTISKSQYTASSPACFVHSDRPWRIGDRCRDES